MSEHCMKPDTCTNLRASMHQSDFCLEYHIINIGASTATSKKVQQRSPIVFWTQTQRLFPGGSIGRHACVAGEMCLMHRS